MNTFRLEIITPERRFLTEDVDSVELPGVKGEFEVLPGHTPFLTPLDAGILTFSREGRYRYASISGGFCEVEKERTVVLARAAEFPNEIDRERAASARDRARTRLTSPDSTVDRNRARRALNRALARLRVADIK